MPAVLSRPASNKRTWKGHSLRKATKMQAPKVKDEPISWTELLWDSLQFQSGVDRAFGRVKKLTKTVATNFPRFGFRIGPFLHPFQTPRNVQGGHEHKHEEDLAEYKRHLLFQCCLATTRSFSTPRTTSSHFFMMNGRVAAVSKRCKQDARNEEVLLSNDKGQSHEIVLMKTAHLQLKELNLQAVTGLQNMCLIEKEAEGKTEWEVVEEVHTLIGNVVESVEAVLIQLSDGLVSVKSSVVCKNTANRSTEDMKRNALVDYLRQSLNDLQQTVSECFFDAIMRLTSFFDESKETSKRVQATLQSLAFECTHLQDRLVNAEQNIVNKIHGWSLTVEATDQEKKRTDNGLKLMEAACSNVVKLQHKVLQTRSVGKFENDALLDETENLDLYLQLSWNWLQELHKAIAILYPEQERCLYDCFLDTLVIAMEGIESYLNQPHENDSRKVKDVLFGDVMFCEKRVLASLTHVYNVFKRAVVGIEQNPALDLTDFVQIQDCCDHFVNVLTVLHSQLTSISVSTEAEHHTLTQSRRDCRIKVLRLAEDYIQSSLYNIHKDNKTTEAVTTMVGELIQNVNQSETTFSSHDDALVQDGLSPSASQTVFNAQANVDIKPLVSSDISNPGVVSENTINLKEKVRIQTPFANPDNHPHVSENTKDQSGSTDEEQAVNGSDCDLVPAEETLLLNDASLDRSLGPLPSSGFFARVGVNEVTEIKYLDQGSSGYVTLRKLGNRPVVVKESECPDLIKRLKRLNREARMHQKINIHPNIVRFLGGWAKPDEHGEDQIVGIITEWCDLGDLYTAIRQAAWIQELDQDGKDISRMTHVIGYRLYKDWNKRLELVVDIASALIYMHSRYVVHRDLTCKNVLLYTVDKSGEFGAKVCDFERARYLPGGEDVRRTKSCANSAPWMGPEVLRNEYYGLKADVYSIGTILWELMYLQNPWTHLYERTGVHITVIQHLLTTGKISLSISDNDAPEDFPIFPQLVTLVKSAWQADPAKRPSMAEFLCRLKQIINCMNST